MHIYKFRIVSEEHEKFFREIEIQANQSFEDFHLALLDCISMEKDEMASFYICDNRWHKIQEIALFDMHVEAAENEEDSVPMKVMADIKLAECINDPNQRMIYVYDFMAMHTFYIELYEILEGDAKTKYPRCVKKTGDIKKTIKNKRSKTEVSETDDLGLTEKETIFDESDDMLDEEDSAMLDNYFDDNPSS
ncbi:MAG: hypothetical protein WCQ95_07225 [Bacteroidota bacterium]